MTVVTALLAEAASLRVAGKPVRPFLMDGSALLSGWLLAMTLPPWAPWWIGVVGSLVAIVVAKQIFGGIGQNLFNPAMVARVALLISAPLEMTTFPGPRPLLLEGAVGFLEGLTITLGGAQTAAHFDAVTSASLLGHVRTELGQGLTLPQIYPDGYGAIQGALGPVAGSMGETSALLILLGGLFLVYKRIITWHIPLVMMATIALLAGVMNLYDPDHYIGPVYHLVSGATLLGAFFIATSPPIPKPWSDGTEKTRRPQLSGHRPTVQMTYPRSSCRARSMPSVSCSSVTRSPTVRSITLSKIKLTIPP